MRVAICGAGIAGPTLANCLERRGDEATIVERAPHVRDDGYMIDFSALVTMRPSARVRHLFVQMSARRDFELQQPP
jgi:2-polyprenyl-6-methoxyphenol hydroxylase-like FAD-dependent oxidoreductase